MSAFTRFVGGVLRLPIGVRLWLALLMLFNFLIPLYYAGRTEANVVLLTFVASFALMIGLTARFGFTRLLGLGHVLWVPLVCFLAARLGEFPTTDLYGTWIKAVIVLNAISLVLDAIDVVRYWRGDTSELDSPAGHVAPSRQTP